MKKILTSSATILAGFFFVLVVLEIGLRFFPVNEGMHSMPVDDSNPISRFEPNRTLIWSRYADMSMVNTVHVNNYGFVSNQDYTTKSSLPLIAVIGDSYVEAAMVPYPETCFGRLARDLSGKARVYSFGVSGAPLSQYLAFAKYARDEFAPKKIIFVIVGNDFDESLFRPDSQPGLHYFQDENGKMNLVRKNYRPDYLTKLGRHSRLLLYLMLNADIRQLPEKIPSLFKTGRTAGYAGQTKSDTDPKRLESSRRAVDSFLQLLPETTGLDPSNIMLVVDGIRPNLYSPEKLAKAEASYFAKMRRYLVEETDNLGFTVIDMQPVFINDYKTNGRRFEYDLDGHWNAYGHHIFSKAVIDSGFLDEYRQN